MKATITINIETPFEDEEQSIEWLSNFLPCANADVSIDCGGTYQFFRQVVKK